MASLRAEAERANSSESHQVFREWGPPLLALSRCLGAALRMGECEAALLRGPVMRLVAGWSTRAHTRTQKERGVRRLSLCTVLLFYE